MALREGYSEFIRYLNELLIADPDFVNNLFVTSFTCNELILNHPSVQAFSPEHAQKKYLGTDGKDPRVRFLGVINGFFGTYENGAGPICADIDEQTGKIVSF
jgi:hypothetical protein